MARGSRLCLLWSLRWLKWFAPAPIAYKTGVLPLENLCTCREISSYGSSTPSFHTPEQWCLAPLVGPGLLPHSLSCGAPFPSPRRLSPCSQPSPLPRNDLRGPKPQHPDLALMSQAGVRWAVALTTCEALAVLCLLRRAGALFF